MARSGLLFLTVVLCQKSIEVLRSIKSKLSEMGIYAAIYKFASGMYTLDIIRVADVTRFLRSVRCIVKRRQVDAALGYLQGRLTGNALLQVLEEEHLQHRRKTSPMRTLGLRFPMTRTKALEVSAIISTKARTEGNRRVYEERVKRRVLSLPVVFSVKDIEMGLHVSKSRAQAIGNLMVREGLVRSHFERVPPRFRKKVFERL